MDSFDGVEVCELVGFFLLDILRIEFDDNKIGLYRDDGLSCFQILSGPKSEKIKKKLCKILKNHGLSITVECHLRITDFLDVTFDLRTGKYYPYRKVNSELSYIQKQSNHPPSITKQISAMISKRISNISCDKESDLCLTEKLVIMKADSESLLNTRDEFVSKCRHMNKFTLRSFKKKLIK